MTERTWQYRVLRWTVPVDDQPHEIGGGKVLHTQSRETGRVEVWTVEWVCDQTMDVSFPKRVVQAYGTGQTLPEYDPDRRHIGSTPDGSRVQHVFEVKP